MAFEKEIRNSRILIMDDVVANVTLLANVLNRMGYKQIKSVTGAPELIAETLEWQPDLIVLELPRMDVDRLSAVEQLRSKYRSQDWIPVLVLSPDADHDLRRKAFAAGVSEFLKKPFDFSELVVRIRNSLLMRTYQEQLRDQNRILEYRVAARTKSLAERTEQLEHTVVELKNSQQQIIQHERLRAFGAMAGGVAHDFNNVLMCVIGYTELLLNDAALLSNTEKTRKFLRSMNTAGVDASSIVARLRNFYRPLEEGDVFTLTDLNALVSEVVPLTQPKWKAQALVEGRDIEVELDLHPAGGLQPRRNPRGGGKPGLQRGRRHAAGRQDHALHAVRRLRGLHRNPRHRHWDDGRSAPALHGALLFHQRGQRHRPRARHGLRHRQAA
jgi:CheY-like chemotaxis protein